MLSMKMSSSAVFGGSRCLSTISAQKKKLLRELYLSEGKYQSPTELANHLSTNIVYFNHKKDNSGLIVVNKPAGVPLQDSDDGFVGLKSALPELSKLLGVGSIKIVKSVQRYASGCVLLSSKEQGFNQATRSLNRATYERCLNKAFLALTSGVPRTNVSLETVDLVQEQIRDEINHLTNKKNSEPVIVRDLMSRRKLKQRVDIEHSVYKANRITVSGEVMCKSESGRNALYKIASSSTVRNFLAVYCADMLSPIIGDHLYSYRARMFKGKMIRVNPQLSPDSNAKVQNLPDWLLDAVGLKTGEEHCLPLHLHLSSIFLPGYFGGNNHLTVAAPPRPFFLGTAECLGLSIAEEHLKTSEPTQYKTVQKKRAKLNMLDAIIPPAEIPTVVESQ